VAERIHPESSLSRDSASGAAWRAGREWRGASHLRVRGASGSMKVVVCLGTTFAGDGVAEHIGVRD
jgi:hypothetical protein